MKKNYFKRNFDLFLLSFKKIDINFIYIFFYDLLFFSAIGFAIFIWFNKLKEQLLSLSTLDLSNLLAMGIEYAEQSIAIMKGFLLFALFSGIMLIVFIIVDLSIFKGLIWCRICKRKFTLRYFAKFLLLNTTWVIIWLILAAIIVFGVREDLVAYLFILLVMKFIHCSLFLHILFTKTNKLRSIKDSFKLGVTKVHHFILPYVLVIIVFILISQLYWLYQFLPFKIETIISGLIFIAFLAWARLYLYSVFNAAVKVYSKR